MTWLKLVLSRRIGAGFAAILLLVSLAVRGADSSELSPDYLFLVDTSAPAFGHKSEIADALSARVLSGLDGQMRSGAALALWTVGDGGATTRYAPLIWSTETRDAVAGNFRRAVLESVYGGRSPFHGAIERALQLPTRSESILLLVVHVSSELTGTGVDHRINAACRASLSGPRPAGFFVTTLLARGGRVVGWSVESEGTGSDAMLLTKEGVSIKEPLAALANSPRLVAAVTPPSPTPALQPAPTVVTKPAPPASVLQRTAPATFRELSVVPEPPSTSAATGARSSPDRLPAVPSPPPVAEPAERAGELTAQTGFDRHPAPAAPVQDELPNSAESISAARAVVADRNPVNQGIAPGDEAGVGPNATTAPIMPSAAIAPVEESLAAPLPEPSPAPPTVKPVALAASSSPEKQALLPAATSSPASRLESSPSSSALRPSEVAGGKAPPALGTAIASSAQPLESPGAVVAAGASVGSRLYLTLGLVLLGIAVATLFYFVKAHGAASPSSFISQSLRQK